MQFEKLTGLAPLALGERSLLDLCAGDGAVTDVMRPYFSRIDVTEVSCPCRGCSEVKALGSSGKSLYLLKMTAHRATL